MTTLEEKAEVLNRQFYPLPAEADLSDIRPCTDGRNYSQEVECSRATKWDIINTVRNLATGKAAGLDEITIEMTKLILLTIMLVLISIFSASLDLGYYPKSF